MEARCGLLRDVLFCFVLFCFVLLCCVVVVLFCVVVVLCYCFVLFCFVVLCCCCFVLFCCVVFCSGLSLESKVGSAGLHRLRAFGPGGFMENSLVGCKI